MRNSIINFFLERSHDVIAVTAFVMCIFFGHIASADKVILHAMVIDDHAAREVTLDKENAYIQEHYPNHKLISVKVRASRFFPIDKAVHAALVKEMNQLALAESDRIDVMILTTHGQTKNEATQLSFFGEFSSQGPNEELKEVFNPVLKHIADDVRVIMHSCSTFCGTNEQIVSRSKAFLTYLGAAKGSIFGLTTPGLDPQLNISKSDLKFFAVSASLGVYTLFVGSFLSGNFEGFTPSWLIKTAIFTGSLTYMMALIDFTLREGRVIAKSKAKIMNWGKLLKFDHSQDVIIEEVSYYYDKPTVYGFGCGSVL
ncbi:MAG: hypothetical protein AB7F59_00325 [Bdellovibrionales bacterium]